MMLGNCALYISLLLSLTENLVRASNDFACGKEFATVASSAVDRIIGGKTANAHDWPWHAGLVHHRHYHYASIPFCGASLINDQWLLTAAHCVVDEYTGLPIPTSSVEVLLGAQDIYARDTRNHVVKRVQKIIPHPKYSKRISFSASDIALIKLSEKVVFTDFIRPVCLPEASKLGCPWLGGEKGYVIGWGSIYNHGPQSDQLLQVEVPLYNHFICMLKLKQLLRNDEFCAGYEEGGKDTCQGDSGGPFLMNEEGRWVQRGIVSWGHGCALPGSPGVYVCVSYFRNWIDEQIKNNS